MNSQTGRLDFLPVYGNQTFDFGAQSQRELGLTLHHSHTFLCVHLE